MFNSSLEDKFDCIIMLTWSNWHEEARSNRYHYATRFGQHIPVYFIQPIEGVTTPTFEDLPEHNLTLVNVPNTYSWETDGQILSALKTRGIRRPLVWVYNAYMVNLLKRMHAELIVYHATEDYFGETKTPYVDEKTINDLLETLDHCDMLVAVSEAVEQNYINIAKFKGQTMVAANGCDYQFWEQSKAHDYQPEVESQNVILYQGGINSRLDYELLLELIDLRPNYSFWLCGDSSYASRTWRKIVKRDNVRYLGKISPEEIAQYARQAAVGIIPFVQEPVITNSLPLKAFEYTACGLPVVTVPITALGEWPDLFVEAKTAQQFAEAIDKILPTRNDPDFVEERMEISETMSYDRRFEEVCHAVTNTKYSVTPHENRLNILVLYDDKSVHVSTIDEHLQAFRKYSRHRIFFAPATSNEVEVQSIYSDIDLNHFDVVVIHFCVRLSMEIHLSSKLAKRIEAYDGLKVLFIQDEYDCTEIARNWIERLDISTVFTCVPDEEREKVYPAKRFPRVDFVHNLTGYVPENPALSQFALPIEERTTLIGYRGRQLPHQYGALGYEKFIIGQEMKRLTEERGLDVDIEVDDAKRIYGDGWYSFVGSCRATLGTESGANVFDDHGKIAAKAAQHRNMPFTEFAERFIGDEEGRVRMNQISPKIFEALRLRTALILFEGQYSGVVEPHKHFIVLKKDYSNVDEIISKLNDIDFLKELTERGYQDVIASQHYSYETFIGKFDKYLAKRLSGPRQARAQFASVPVLLRSNSDLAGTEMPTQIETIISDLCLGASDLKSGMIAGSVFGASSVAKSSSVSMIAQTVSDIFHSASMSPPPNHQPSQPQAESTTPDPQPSQPQAESTTPDPQPSQPQPESTTPDPQPSQPQPESTTPDPQPSQSKPLSSISISLAFKSAIFQFLRFLWRRLPNRLRNHIMGWLGRMNLLHVLNRVIRK